MADNSELTQEQIDLQKKVAESYDASGKSMDTFDKVMEIVAKQAKTRNQIEKLTAEQKQTQTKAHIATLTRLQDQLKAGIITQEDFNEQAEESTSALRYLQKGLDAATKAEAKKVLQDVKNIELAKQSWEKFGAVSTKLGVDLTRQLLSSTGSILKGIQSGSDGIQMATSIATAGLGMMNTGIQGAAGAGAAAGEAMAAMGGKARVAGLALQGLSMAAGLAGKAFTEYEKFKIEFMSKEAEKTVSSFRALSSSGAMFAEGLDGARQATKETGLSMDTLSNIQKNNAQSISSAGLGMAAGFKLMTKTFSGPAGAEMKNSLMNLGYTFEEQGELVSKTMEQLRRSGQDPLKADIQASTREYAVNLRTIAAITGKDAKARMEQAKKVETMAAVRAKLMKMEREGNAGASQKFRDAVAKMDEKDATSFSQMFVTAGKNGQGGVTNDLASNVEFASSPELKQQFDNMNANIADSSKSVKDASLESSKILGNINQTRTSEGYADKMAPIGVASMFGGGTAQKIMGEVDSKVGTSLGGVKDAEAAAAATNAVVGQMNDAGQTMNRLNKILLDGEATRATIEGQLIGQLDEYSKLMSKVMDYTKSILSGKSPFDKVEDAASSFGSMLLSIGTSILTLGPGVAWAAKGLGLFGTTAAASAATTAVATTATAGMATATIASGAATAATAATITGAGAAVVTTTATVAGAGTAIAGTGAAIATTGTIVAGTGATLATAGTAIAGTGAAIAGTGAAIAGTTATIATAGTAIVGTGTAIAGTGAAIATTGTIVAGTGTAIAGTTATIATAGTAIAGTSASVVTAGTAAATAGTAAAGAATITAGAIATTVAGAAAAGAVGYGIGTLIDKGMSAAIQKVTGVQGATFGTLLYDLTHSDPGKDGLTLKDVKQQSATIEKVKESTTTRTVVPDTTKQAETDESSLIKEQLPIELGSTSLSVLTDIYESINEAKTVQVTSADFKGFVSSFDNRIKERDIAPTPFSVLDLIGNSLPSAFIKIAENIDFKGIQTTLISGTTDAIETAVSLNDSANEKIKETLSTTATIAMDKVVAFNESISNKDTSIRSAFIDTLVVGAENFNSMINDTAIAAKDKNDSTTSLFNKIQESLTNVLAPSGATATPEKKESEQQQLILEIAKMNGLLKYQNELSEKAIQHQLSLVSLNEYQLRAQQETNQRIT